MSGVNHYTPFPVVGQFSLAGTFAETSRPQMPCTPGYDPVYDGYYPFHLSLGSARWAYWRVRSWHFSGSLTYDIVDDGGTGSFDYDEIIQGTASDERDLVCGEQIWIAEDFGVNVTRFNFWDAPIQGGNPYGPNMYYDGAEVGAEYAPRLYFRDDLGGSGSQISSNPNEGTFIGNAFIALDGGFLGSSPIYCDTTTFALLDGVLDLSPSSYWPYDPGDGGGPVYDSTTGSLLRPEALQPGFTWLAP